MAPRRDAEWRDRASTELLLRHLPFVEVEGPVLVVGDSRNEVAASLTGRGIGWTRWDRRALGGRPAAAWPPAGPFPVVLLRLPPDKGELAMTLHAAASVMTSGGTLLVHGARDEGIQAAPAVMDTLFGKIATLGTGGRCRVLMGSRREGHGRIRGSLAEWREVVDPGHPLLPPEWVSYPGVFAHGRLDPGTRLLLETVPELPFGSRVLDYGCGSGVVGGALLARGHRLDLDLLDVDAVALEAARENVPGARLLLGDGLPSGAGPWDAIISNPPFHRGKVEDRGMILSLVESSPACLTRGGRLVLVAQRRIALEGPFGACFRKVEVRGEDSLFRVWEGRGPRARGGRRQEPGGAG